MFCTITYINDFSLFNVNLLSRLQNRCINFKLNVDVSAFFFFSLFKIIPFKIIYTTFFRHTISFFPTSIFIFFPGPRPAQYCSSHKPSLLIIHSTLYLHSSSPYNYIHTNIHMFESRISNIHTHIIV